MDLGGGAANSSACIELCDGVLGTELKLPALVHAPELTVDVPDFCVLRLAATK